MNFSRFLYALLFWGSYLNAQTISFQTNYSITAMPGFQSRTNVVATTDGGYIMPAINWDYGTGTGNVVLVKTTATGSFQWANRLMTNLHSTSSFYKNAYVAQTTDGGYVVETLLAPANSADDPSIVVFRTDPNANLIWQKSFKGDFISSATVMEANDGGIILTGTLADGAELNNFWAAKLDATGAFVWSKSYDLGMGNEEATTACYMSDGSILISGMTFSGFDFSGDIGMIKIDGNGNVIWGNIYEGAMDDSPIEVKQLSDGDIILVGRAGNELPNTGCWDICIVRLTTDGNLDWNYFYGGDQCDEGYSVAEATDGSLIFACEPESFIGNSQSSLLKTSPSGDFIWMKTYNDINGTFPSSVIRTADGGYALAGVYGTFSSTDVPLFLNKTNEEGDVTCGTQLVYPVKSPYPLNLIQRGTSRNSIQPIIESHTFSPEAGAVTVVCEVTVDNDNLNIPNVFTPNENGTNDLFQIKYTGDESYQVWIYDRWGVLMFETNDKNKYWDGNALNGKQATAGTYYYVVVIAGKENFTGFLTLLR